MKKRVAKACIAVLSIITAVSLTACGKSAVGRNTENQTESGTEGQNESAGMINPWVVTDLENMRDFIGTNLNIPEDAENVSCVANTISYIGAVDFDWANVNFCARVKRASAYEDISGYYYVWDIEEDTIVNGNEGKLLMYTGDEGTFELLLWYDKDNSYVYSLSAQAKDLNGFDITAIACQIYAKD